MLKDSEERYRTLIQNVPITVYRTAPGPKGRFLMANPTFLKMFGLESDEELKEITVADVYMSPKARKAFSDDLLAKESVTEVELPLRKKDGTPFWGSVTARVVYDESGKSAYFDCTIVDITERKWAQEALRESEKHLKTITDSIQTGIVLIDAETHIIVDANPAAVKIIGAPKGKIIGHVCHKYFCLAEKGKCPITDLGQEMDNSERILLKANGEEVPILKTVTSILLSGRECLLHSFVDLTGQKQLEAQLSQARKVEAIGTLAGGIAHNFNNLLMGVMGNTSLMLFEIDSAHPDYERLRNIEKSVESGSRLTRQLLGYAREGRYEIKPISLNELVRETSDTFATTKKEIRVHQELAQDLSGIKADQGQIEQILLNLYVNASDAMPAGGDLFLKTANVTHKDMTGKLYKAKPGNYVLLTVRDTGMGMDKRTQDRIFDPFFTTKAMGRGTGLGLASVYGTVKAHGGYIDVESKKGHGSTFEIYLPAASKKELIKVRELPETILKGKETILLVDDEDMVLYAGEGMLKAMGYKVLLARSGKEAIELYKKNKDRIDIVLLDMIMPDMGGGETYDRMKDINPDIKVLLLSGYSIDGQAKEILERGCDSFIQKPFNMRQLSQRIRKILDKKYV